MLRADLIQQLMCQGEIPVAALERRHGIDFGDVFRRRTRSGSRRWRPTAWCGTSRAASVATPRGRLLLRNIAMCFDRYLDRPKPPAAAAALLPRDLSRRGAPRERHRRSRGSTGGSIADDGDALHFCSTCAFSQACLSQGMDKSALMDLHVLVEHVGPLPRGRARVPRGRSVRRDRRGARRHGQDLRRRSATATSTCSASTCPAR